MWGRFGGELIASKDTTKILDQEVTAPLGCRRRAWGEELPHRASAGGNEIDTMTRHRIRPTARRPRVIFGIYELDDMFIVLASQRTIGCWIRRWIGLLLVLTLTILATVGTSPSALGP